LKQSVTFTPANNLSEKYKYAFLIVPNFSLFPYSSAIEVLRMANQILKKNVYSWETISFASNRVEASCAMEFHPKLHSSSDTFDYSAVFVCGGNHIREASVPETITGLKGLYKQNVPIGSFSTGSYLLAKAGLLDGYQCTIHWDRIAATREEFPRINFRDDIYFIDRDRYTCAGGAAAIDMMLDIVKEQQGGNLAASISDQFLIDRIRTPHDHQRVPLRHKLGTNQPKITEAAKLMDSNLEEPLSIGELAAYVGISKRQLERLFQQYLKCTPLKYYTSLRLKSARRLLMQTEKSILDISCACGFSSAAHFSRSYYGMFGLPPSEDRRRLLSSSEENIL
jgi:transcriptional regulator GlxA family with amidase domain